MTLTVPRSPVEIMERQYTVADLAEMPAELPSGPVRWELDNGRLVSMAPPGDEHGAIELKIAGALLYQGEMRGFGKARTGESGVVLWRNPDRTVGADAVFIAAASLPLQRSPEGYLETIPDIAVEVVSKNDTRPYVQRKVDDYLAAGVKEVWVAWPAERAIVVHHPGAEAVTYSEERDLTTPIIPGFLLRVADAFVL